MKKTFKKITAIILAAVILSVMPAGMKVSASSYTDLYNAFINDSRFCNGASYGDRGPYISPYSSYQCCAYTADFVKYVFGNNSPRGGAAFYSASEIRSGDVIHVEPSHWFVVLERNGNSLYTAEGNYAGRVRVTNGAYSVVNGVLCEYGSPYRTFDVGYHFLDSSSNYADIGTNFTAPILNKASWKIIEENTSDYRVRIAKETGFANQLWYFERQSDGSYKISSCLTGRCLDVWDASSAEGAAVQTYQSNDTTAQRWYIYKQGDGYIFKPKCSSGVLDLTGNNTADGTSLQIWTKNDTTAQTWAIYRGDECCILKAPTLSVQAGDSASNTVFTWNNVYGAGWYDLKIWKGQADVGEAYHVKSSASSGYGVTLPAGTYQAYVSSGHKYASKKSSIVSFTVLDRTYTISFNANGGSGAPGNQTKVYGKDLTLSSTKPTRSGYAFVGWAKSSSATSAVYQPGGTYSENNGATLYAVWKADAVRISGDVNDDGKVTTMDATLIKRYIVGGYSIPVFNKSNADVNGDGKVTTMDATLIKRYIVGGYGVVLK